MRFKSTPQKFLLSSMLGSIWLLMSFACQPAPAPCGGGCQTGYVCINGEFCLKSCAKEEKRCSGSCVVLASSAAHCGKCGNACKQGEYCKDGACVEGVKPPTCDTGLVVCGSDCADTQNSTKHCGKCDNACATGQICIVGICTDECSNGERACGGKCVDTKTNKDNCGNCGRQCAKSLVCKDGKCVCPTGETECLGVCVQLQNDDQNCGKCGIKCGSALRCESGKCTCRAGKTLCGGKCVDIQSDASHCGGCGQLCDSNKACVGGVCAASDCVSGLKRCAGKCVDTQINKEHCGLCGKACPTGMFCQAGVCTCPSGTTLCDGACVELQSNASHCGKCEVRCDAGERCRGGVCTCSPGEKKCTLPDTSALCVLLQSNKGHCGSCNNACADGFTCVNGQCKCPPGKSDCDGKCVDIKSDPKHCGSCSNACAGFSACSAGVCSCAPGTIECKNACVNLKTDKDHCGTCGSACPKHTICSGGTCNCSGKLVCSGVCVDEQTDLQNCGKCGTQCKGKEACIQGACKCQPPFVVCGGDCVDLRNDPKHCNKCGVACVAGVKCVDFACRPQWGVSISGNPSVANAIAADSAGNAYFLGEGKVTGNPFSPATFPNYHEGMYLAKVNNTGTYQWAQALSRNAFPLAVVTDAQGNAIVIGRGQGAFGRFHSGNGSRLFVAKVNGKGEWQWAAGFPFPADYFITATFGPGGDLYIGMAATGSFKWQNKQYTPGGARDSYVLKLSASNGAFKSLTQIHSKGDSDRVLGLSVDAQENVYVSGYFSGKMIINNTQFTGQSSGRNHDGMLLKFNKSGGLVWHHQLSTPQSAAFVYAGVGKGGVVQAIGWFNGAVLVAGQKLSTKGSDDILLFQINQAGVMQPVKQVGGIHSERPRFAQLDKDGNFFVMGTFTGQASFGAKRVSSRGNTDIFVTKILVATGVSKWVTAGGSSQGEYPLGFFLSGQSYYIVGASAGQLDFGGLAWPKRGSTRGFALKNYP